MLPPAHPEDRLVRTLESCLLYQPTLPLATASCDCAKRVGGISMVHHGATKSGLWSEILLVGSGMVIFVPLLLILVAALTGWTTSQ